MKRGPLTKMHRHCCMHPTMWIILILISVILATHASEGSNVSTAPSGRSIPKTVEVVQWKFHEFATQITIILFLFVMILIKMLFHVIPKVADYIPESLLLILLGVVFGSIVRFGINAGSFESSVWKLTPGLFFNYLLPPIILEASYSLYNRTFSEYLGVVLIFAVLGTILNFLLIGFLMHGMLKAGAMGDLHDNFDLKGMLLFSSLIVAVDPVAVLAIFQDIGVELSLYYIVFGESLLNDAITVVLYEIMSAFAGEDVVTGEQIGLGIASFLTVSLGGLLIGVVIGILSCLITRCKSHLNAFTLILLAYSSYIMADTVGWSGIISMIGCGLIQAAYAFHNLDSKSVILVHKMIKVVAEMSESVIFLFLGVEVLSDTLVWQSGFILWGLVFCLLARSIVVLGITAILNKVNVDNNKISYPKQLILIYGGLRGAVAFSLAVLISPDQLGFHGQYNRSLIISATLFIILFTVGFMGITMKPLVKLLKIRIQSKQKLSLFTVLINSVTDETLAGIEVIANVKGRNVVREFFIQLDEKYFRRILQREPETYDHKIIQVYEKIALKLHFAQMKPDQVDGLLEDIPETLRPFHVGGSTAGSEGTNSSDRDASTGYIDTIVTKQSVKPDVESTGVLKQRRASADEPSVAQLLDCMRSTRMASIAPNARRQASFDEAFRDMMRLRSRAAITMGIVSPTYPPAGEDNSAFQTSEEVVGVEQKTPKERRVSIWADQFDEEDEAKSD